MAADTLGELLQQFSLEEYYETFNSVGIRSTTHLLALTMQDYPTLGITSMQDRRKMFHLIQNVKDKEDATFSARPIYSRGGQSVKKKERDEVSKLDSVKEDGPKTPLTKPSTSRSQRVTTPNRHNFSYGIPSSKLKMTASKSKLTNGNSNIKVCVRKRPLGNDELATGETDVVDVEIDDNLVVINAPKVTVDLTKYLQKFSFVFDEVFDESFSNHQVYEKTAKPLVEAIFTEGAKATCFAYGCTGSGKTYTMLGTDNIPGLYLLAASDIFNILYSGSHGNGLGLWVSFYEIYCGQLFDLLNDRSKLFARENASHQVCIVGLTERQVNNVEELMEVIESGGNSRSTGSTGVNADSSRSHAILQLDLKYQQDAESIGRFSFVDLAGSERAADVTDTDKQTRMEGAEINQSLLALKECIRSLDQESRHTPFRQSKLTQVLKDSFVGNTRTCMIANVSPCQSSCENTLNTLRYADRVKELNKVSPDPLSPRPVTVHGSTGKDTTTHMTRITNSSIKNNNMSKSAITEMAPSTPAENQVTRNLQVPNKRPRTNPKSRGIDEPVLQSLQLNPNTPRHSSLLSRPETSPAIDLHNPRSRSRLQYLNKEQSYNMLKTNKPNLLEERQSRNRPLTQQSTSKLDRQKGDDALTLKRNKSNFNVENDRKNIQQNIENRLEQTAKFSTRQKQQYSCQTKVDKVEEVKMQRGQLNSNRKRIINKLEVLPKDSRILEEGKRGRISPKLKEPCNQKDNSHIQSSGITAQNENGNSQENLSQSTRTMKMQSKKGKGQKNLSLNTGSIRTRSKKVDESITPNVNILKLDNEVDTLMRTNVQSDSLVERRTVVQEDKSFQSKKVTSDSLHKERHVPEEKLYENEKKEKNENRMRSGLETPQANNRYSKGIKARLAQLFSSKNTPENKDLLQDHKGVTHESSTVWDEKAPFQRGLKESMTHRVISEEQIVAAHHTQLALVTGLCHEEMVLLKQRDNDNQNFLEYIAQVEEILLQKQTCIGNLQEKLQHWKTSVQQTKN